MIETWEKIIDPNFINAELIGPVGSERVVTITDIDYAECFDQKTNNKIKKQTLFFSECKPMVLNKTNAKALRSLFCPNGEEPKLCIGHKIMLYVISLKVGGKQTTGIRLKEYSEEKCPVCGKIIVPYSGKTVKQIIDISNRNFGTVMCGSCMSAKAKENK